MSYADIVRGSFGGDRFTIISNLAARDRRLSYKARGLLTAIGSHREGWGITAEILAETSPDGIASVRSGLKELEKAGYLRRYRLRNELGQLAGAHWVITDDPTSLEERIAELAAQVGEKGLDLFQRQSTRSEPKCDSPTLADPTVGEPTEADRTPKNTSHQNTSTKKTGEGEEGAQARASDPPVDNPVDNSGDDGEWGIPATPKPAAQESAAVKFAKIVITDIAAETGLGLDEWQHKRLVLEHLPTALAVVREMGDEAISGTELVEWLRSDLDTAQSLYAVLSTRLRPDYLRQALPVWVRRNRTPGGLPGPASPSPPAPRREQDTGPAADPEPFSPGWTPPPTCRIHPSVTLTADHRGALILCRECETPDSPTPAEDADDTPDPAPTPDPGDLIDVISSAMGADAEPDMPDHCGARNCRPATRHLFRLSDDGTGFVGLGPCRRCHPDHAQEDAA